MTRARTLWSAAFIFAGLPLSAVEAEAPEAGSGNYMVEVCRENNAGWDAGICFGRLEGWEQGIAMGGDTLISRMFCVPEQVTFGQKLDVYRAYLRGHPEVRHYRWELLYTAALHGAWPCPGGGSLRFEPNGGMTFSPPK